MSEAIERRAVMLSKSECEYIERRLKGALGTRCIDVWREAPRPTGYLMGWNHATWERAFAATGQGPMPDMYDLKALRAFSAVKAIWLANGGEEEGPASA